MGAAYDMAVILYQQKRYDLAREKLSRELAEQPNSPNAHAMLALCLTEQEQFRGARQHAEEAIAKGPEIAFAHYSLAWVFYKDRQFVCRRRMAFTTDQRALSRKRLQLASDALQEALRLNPTAASYFGLLGWVRYERGDFRGASKAALLGLEHDPACDDCLRVQAYVLHARGKFPAAEQASRTALSARPESVLNHVTHGKSLLLSGNWRGALEHYRQAMRIDPNYRIARNGLISALSARNPAYRIVLAMNAPHHSLQKLAVFCIVVGLPVAAINLRDRLPQPGLLILLSLVPVIILITVPAWCRVRLQFDPEGRHLLPFGQRIGAWTVVALVVCLFPYLAYECITSPSPMATLMQAVPVVVTPLWALAVIAVLTRRIGVIISRNRRSRIKKTQIP